MKDQKHKTKGTAIAILANTELNSLLGPPPLLEGEDASAYEELRWRIRNSVAPEDVIEELWVRDVIDLLWETLRLRRIKAKLMLLNEEDAMATLVRPLVKNDTYGDIFIGLRLRSKQVFEDVRRRLERVGLDREAIYAKTLESNLDLLERIDRMIMQCEARRNMVLREIDRHRDVLARRLREATTAVIEDAEFVEIDNAQTALEDCPT